MSCNFTHAQKKKKKKKFEIFNDKKIINKNIFSVITKNSNWKISTKNSVTFKR